MSEHILVVDDDPHICEVIVFALEKSGRTPVIAHNGTKAWDLFCAQTPDIIVLDVGLPDIDGLELCRRIRKISDTPILFLSARDEEIDRILGLELGGDDYVTKPFSPRELVARINVILRRRQPGGPDTVPPPSPAPQNQVSNTTGQLTHGALTMDRERHMVLLDQKTVPLTALEFEMLACLIARPGIVLSRDQLMQGAYAHNIHVSDRTIDSHIRNIRAKFAKLHCQHVIETVKSVGFRIGPCTTSQTPS